MLAIEYALFTFGITIFIVTLSHGMGESAVDAAGERAIATAIGLAIVAIAFAVWRDREMALPGCQEPRHRPIAHAHRHGDEQVAV
jgi:uncharacterized membrane protein YccC